MYGCGIIKVIKTLSIQSFVCEWTTVDGGVCYTRGIQCDDGYGTSWFDRKGDIVSWFRKKNNHWDVVRDKEYKDRAKNREVHASQNMVRGERGEVDSPIKERILSVFLAGIFGVLGFFLGYLLLIGWGFFEFVAGGTGASFLDFDAGSVDVMGDWKIYAWTGFVFLLAWLIANERLMASWRSKHSMIDATDINSYENDQFIMLPQEMQRTFDWFPDTGAHSSVQVSSMISHMMLDRKGLKKIDVTQRHRKDVTEDGRVVHYKGEPVVDADGQVVTAKLPLIDEKFGQDLFTASGIPVDQKEIRVPVDVRKIEYNPVDDTKNRKDRDKQPYDTVAELINNDWEFPEYEVQRPAGAYLVDTAPVNTMV